MIGRKGKVVSYFECFDCLKFDKLMKKRLNYFVVVKVICVFLIGVFRGYF